ncbi:MAG: hypothetical protein Q9207_002884 [Kuettlingeria erythrocarpa]
MIISHTNNGELPEEYYCFQGIKRYFFIHHPPPDRKGNTESESSSAPSRSHTAHNPAHTFDISITQQANWELPESIKQVIDLQAKVYAEPKPKEASEETKARLAKHTPDSRDGTIYSQCNECDPNGGPTDCQHPEDPKEYNNRLNPIRDDDPAFAHRSLPLPAPRTPRKPTPSDKLITKASPSKASVSPVSNVRLILSYSGGIEKAVEYLKGFASLDLTKAKQLEHPDEMLAARYLSDFLTENIEEGVATSYIVFSTHGTLLGYSSPVEVKTARNIAALAAMTWRVNDLAVLHGNLTTPTTSSANLLKTVTMTPAGRVPGLYNMICLYKDLLIAVQWIKGGFLAAAMVEATEADHIYDADKDKLGKEALATAADTGEQDDGAWVDDGAVEETSEDEANKAKGRKDPIKQAKLFEKSQGLAEAMREQWNADDFKMPRGFR